MDRFMSRMFSFLRGSWGVMLSLTNIVVLYRGADVMATLGPYASHRFVEFTKMLINLNHFIVYWYWERCICVAYVYVDIVYARANLPKGRGRREKEGRGQYTGSSWCFCVWRHLGCLYTHIYLRFTPTWNTPTPTRLTHSLKYLFKVIIITWFGIFCVFCSS